MLLCISLDWSGTCWFPKVVFILSSFIVYCSKNVFWRLSEVLHSPFLRLDPLLVTISLVNEIYNESVPLQHWFGDYRHSKFLVQGWLKDDVLSFLSLGFGNTLIQQWSWPCVIPSITCRCVVKRSERYVRLHYLFQISKIDINAYIQRSKINLASQFSTVFWKQYIPVNLSFSILISGVCFKFAKNFNKICSLRTWLVLC